MGLVCSPICSPALVLLPPLCLFVRYSPLVLALVVCGASYQGQPFGNRAVISTQSARSRCSSQSEMMASSLARVAWCIPLGRCQCLPNLASALCCLRQARPIASSDWLL